MRNKARSYIISFSALATVVSALWGCAGTNNSNNGLTCTASGCYNSSGQLVSGTGYGTGVGPTSIVLQTQGSMMVLNQSAWNTFLRGNQACYTSINSCNGLNGPPGLTIVVNDPTFSTENESLGSLTVLAQGSQLPYPNIYFRQTASGFAGGVQTNPYVQINSNNTNSGAIYIVYVTGSVTSSGQQVMITSNGQTIARGTLARIQ
jgi:hypothetical protein